MRAQEIVELRREAVHLAFLKRPTKKQAQRLLEITERVDGEKWHPSPRKPAGTGKPDILGINWRQHVAGGHMTMRRIRRANRFGYGENPKRSRRQRNTRKRRTGGVR